MTAFTFCKTCKTPIHRRNIVREKDVRNAPTHLVILFKCPTCKNNDRLVAPRDEWLQYVGAALTNEETIDLFVDAFAGDLEVLVHTPQDLYNIWASYGTPPPIEVMRKCECRMCEDKRNVTGS